MGIEKKTSALVAERMTVINLFPGADFQGLIVFLGDKRSLYKQLLTQMPNYILFYSAFSYSVEACIFIKHRYLSVKPIDYLTFHPAKSIVHSRH